MNNEFKKFQKYFKENKEAKIKANDGSADRKVIDEFNKEFPIEKIKNLSLDEYIYKNDDNSTFCSRLEKHYQSYNIGPSIRAGSINGKYGIYFKDNHYVNYKRDSDGNVIDNPEQYYEILNKQLVEVLTNIKNGIQDVDYSKYDHLRGMWNAILKMAYYINPDNNTTFGSNDLLAICKCFDIPVTRKDNALNWSYKVKKYIDENISESAGLQSSQIGSLLWDYYTENIRTETGSDNPKVPSTTALDSNNIKTSNAIAIGKNTIYYGVPGCGKSFQVNKIAEKYAKDCVIRTVFHPDYTYSDFVGQVMPITKNNKIEYHDIPGPLTKALAEAYKNSNRQVLLIIEEINRGNAAAIFGDIFQLLDRTDYEIENEFICSYLKNNTNNKFKGSKLKLPNNLTIIATMNTSDQNVYTLDNAFRRRFEYVRVINDFDKDKYSLKLKETKIALFDISWGSFIDIINKYIVEQPDLLLNNEDKRLGVYSITSEELNDKFKFADKVLFYLWDNIGKYNGGKLFKDEFKLYDQVIDYFIGNKDIFCDDILEKFKLEKIKVREETHE